MAILARVLISPTLVKGGEGGFEEVEREGNFVMNLLLKSTLRLLGINAGACLRHELRPRGSGLTLSGAFNPLKGRSLAPPNGSIKAPALLKWMKFTLSGV
jgi:hypothetical protein